MSQKERVRKELEREGLLHKDGGLYGDMIGKAVLELWETFEKQGHSGMSASITATIFKDLVDGTPLSELTDDPYEWHNVSDTMGEELWQNTRSYSCFSEDSGKTYYDNNRPRKWVRRALPWRLYRKLPRSVKFKTHKSVAHKVGSNNSAPPTY